MRTCDECGTIFDPVADYEYVTYTLDPSDPYDDGDFNLGEVYDMSERTMCPECALRICREDYAAGLAYQFSLDTSLPPEDYSKY